jgi:hypothetical protein
MRKTLGMTAAAVLASLSLLALAATSAGAAPLAAAARFDPQPTVATGSDLLEVRHRYRSHNYGDDFYYGYYPFTLNDYPPYVYAHPPRYQSRPSRAVNRSCRHWSGRCAANWGPGNNNYYGCLRYHGC